MVTSTSFDKNILTEQVELWNFRKYEKTPQNNLKFHYRKNQTHISISKSKSWERLLILHRQVVGKSKIDGNIAAPIFGVYLVTVATFALIVFWNPYKKARPRLRNICWWDFQSSPESLPKGSTNPHFCWNLKQ